MNTVTIEQVNAAITAFTTTTLPPMCKAWDTLRRTMVTTIAAYEEQTGEVVTFPSR